MIVKVSHVKKAQSWVRWHVPVISATQEAEAGGRKHKNDTYVNKNAHKHGDDLVYD